MPTLQNLYQVNKAAHRAMIDKNICANLIRHEYIVTTLTKAKRAQPYIERFLNQAFKQVRSQPGDLYPACQFKRNSAFEYLQPPDRIEVGQKIVNDLVHRYPKRQTGFTRVIKLEPRLGEDKAPMAVLELVDSDFEIKFWYTAKVVARLELQGIEMDDVTRLNVDKVVGMRVDGEKKFRDAVETCKVEFFKYDGEKGEVMDEEVKKNLENFRGNMEYHGGSLSGTLLVSKKFNTQPRPDKGQEGENAGGVIPPSPFLAEKKA